MNKVIFRQMTIDDYENLISLWESANLPYKPNGRDTKENIKKQLSYPTNSFILAEYNGKIIGSIIASHNGRKGWINRLSVHPDFRHKGIAAKLITKAEEFLKQQGIGIYAALVEGWNKPSEQLFKKMNYKEFEGIIYFTKRIRKDI
jgi:ribosomal protein S18 acetylase RimI-like enzyme